MKLFAVEKEGKPSMYNGIKAREIELFKDVDDAFEYARKWASKDADFRMDNFLDGSCKCYDAKTGHPEYFPALHAIAWITILNTK